MYWISSVYMYGYCSAGSRTWDKRWGPSPKKLFSAPRASVWSKNKPGGGGGCSKIYTFTVCDNSRVHKGFKVPIKFIYTYLSDCKNVWIQFLIWPHSVKKKIMMKNIVNHLRSPQWNHWIHSRAIMALYLFKSTIAYTVSTLQRNRKNGGNQKFVSVIC